MRETLVRTFDSRRVLIPNAKVLTDTIEVQTHHSLVRSRVSVVVDHTADADAVADLLRMAVGDTPGVVEDPPPQVLAAALDGGVTLECRYWTGSSQREITAARDRLIRRVRADLIDGDIPTPAMAVQIDVTPRVEHLLNDHR